MFLRVSIKLRLFVGWFLGIYKSSSQESDTATRVQILDETDYISHSTNILAMNPIILPLPMGK